MSKLPAPKRYEKYVKVSKLIQDMCYYFSPTYKDIEKTFTQFYDVNKAEITTLIMELQYLGKIYNERGFWKATKKP